MHTAYRLQLSIQNQLVLYMEFIGQSDKSTFFILFPHLAFQVSNSRGADYLELLFFFLFAVWSTF